MSDAQISSDTKITIGNTIGDVFGFLTSRFFSVIKVAWLPLIAGSVAMGAWMFLTMRPLAMAYVDLATAAGDPTKAEQSSAAFLNAITEMGVMPLLGSYLILMLIGYLIYAIPTVAYSRMVVEGYAPKGPAYLKLGSKEIMVALNYFIITLLAFVLAFIVAIIPVAVFGGIAGLSGTTDPTAIGGSVIFGMILAFLLGLFVLCWVFAKFGLAFPIASLEGGLGLGRAWSMSSGHTMTITVTIFLAYLIMMVLMFVAMIIFSIISIPLTMIFASSDSLVLPIIVFGVLYLFLYLATYSVMMAMPIALFASVYRRIKGSPAVAETFA